jgi:hypothetical protein
VPRYSGVTFAVQHVEVGGKVAGYVLSGYLNKNQLNTLRNFVDQENYERSKRWRGQYLEMAKVLVSAIDEGLSSIS